MRPNTVPLDSRQCEFTAPEQEIALNMLTSILENELFSDLCQDTEAKSPINCPHCNSAETTKRGKDGKGRQRYECKACKTSFTAYTKRPLSYSHLPSTTWQAFIECHVGLLNLRESADICDVSLKTAFRMRHRLLKAIANRTPSDVPADTEPERQCPCSQRDTIHAAYAFHAAKPTPTHAQPSSRIDPSRISLTVSAGDYNEPRFSINQHVCENTSHAVNVLSREYLAAALPSMRNQFADPPNKHPYFDRFLARFRRTTRRTRLSYQMWHRWILFVKLAAFARNAARHTVARALSRLSNRAFAAVLSVDHLVRFFEQRALSTF